MVCENRNLLNNGRDLGRNRVDIQKLLIPAIFVMKCGMEKKNHMAANLKIPGGIVSISTSAWRFLLSYLRTSSLCF